MAHFLRSVPVGRRIFFSVFFFAIAVGILAFSGWRSMALVTDYNQRVSRLQNFARDVANTSKLIGRLQAQVLAYLNKQESASVELVQKISANISDESVKRLLESENPPTETLQNLQKLTHAYVNAFEVVKGLNDHIDNTYKVIESKSTESMGLFTILNRAGSQGEFSKPLGASVQKANESFVAAMVDINAFYLTSDSGRALGATNKLSRINETVPIMKILNKTEMYNNVLTEIDKRTNILIESVNTLDKLFEDRDKLVRNELAVIQKDMNDLVDSLSTYRESQEDRLIEELKNGAWQTLKASAVIILVVLLIGIFANGVIAESIRSPLLKLNDIMQDLAKGNWDRAVEGDAEEDEIGAMARTLKVFKYNTLRMHQLEIEKREALAKEKEETERALMELDHAHTEIQILNERLSSENLRLGAELEVSRRIQTMLLPKEEELKSIEGLDVATFMEPAEEVGGDYYDILRKEDSVRISIGDVTGHGLESGVVMLMTQSAVRTLTTSSETNLATTLDVLNRTIFDNIQRMGSSKNLTFSLIEYKQSRNPKTNERLPLGTMRIIGQHESVIIVRADGAVEEIDTLYLGMPIGLVDDIAAYMADKTFEISEGDAVVLYTDGITEAANNDNLLYGLDRLKFVCRENRRKDARAIVDAVIEDVRMFVGDHTIYDDLTLIIIKQDAIAKPAPDNLLTSS